jgi:hypothetical protein
MDERPREMEDALCLLAEEWVTVEILPLTCPPSAVLASGARLDTGVWESAIVFPDGHINPLEIAA